MRRLISILALAVLPSAALAQYSTSTAVRNLLIGPTHGGTYRIAAGVYDLEGLYDPTGKPVVSGWPKYGPRPLLTDDSEPLTVCVTLSTHPGKQHCWQP